MPTNVLTLSSIEIVVSSKRGSNGGLRLGTGNEHVVVTLFTYTRYRFFRVCNSQLSKKNERKKEQHSSTRRVIGSP